MSKCTYVTRGPVLDLVCDAPAHWSGDVGGGVQSARCDAHTPAWVKRGQPDTHEARLRIARKALWGAAILAGLCGGALLAWLLGVL